ncbi:hypothetical protein SAMN04487968_109159 [Nocardioides terrae]|uniref:4-amino-4-deoxy-L-arabinose transferase n=1 Tax=Nocardioides terrae TaxID=574651 RepID=A0A1I1L5G3_9ACTN|nr:hypothetical protein [Nocardioides terrae]SFC68269.1 hypothetical protein SAMN04487968_109159 [Nocardioides terrae]
MAATSVEAPDPGGARSATRGWWVAAWVCVAVAVLGHVWVLRSSFAAGTPSFNLDEVASLMPGRALLGLATPEVGGAGYFPLSAILVSPIWWFTSDPATFYRVALLVSTAIGLVALWPLTRIATRFGLTTPQALAVAGIVMAVPARTVQAEYLLAEKPLFLVVALAMLAVVRLSERPTYGRALLVSLLVALSYFTHARMPTLVVATAVWFVLLAVRHLRIGLVGLVSVLVMSGIARWTALRIVRLASGFHQGGSFGGALRPGLLARTIVGESWSQLVSTFGLVSLGVVVIAALAFGEARRRIAGPALFLVLAVGAMFAGSAIDWAQPKWLHPTTRLVRLDVWIYGRYVDPLFALVLLVALAAVVRGARRWEVRASAVLSLAVVAVTLLWLAPQAPTGGSVTPAHAPGVAAFHWARPDHPVPTGTLPTFTDDTRFWLIASLVALVPVALLLVARHRPAVVLGAVLVLGAAGTASANVASDAFHELRNPAAPVRAMVVGIVHDHPGTSVSYFKECPGRSDEEKGLRNRFAWLLLPTVLGSDRDADVVVACETSPAAGRPGSVPLQARMDGFYLVWIRPGPLQDALRAEGLLQPVS